MVCDYPAAYEGQPGFDFIKKIPTVWDEMIVPDAVVGEYISIARRKSENWFIGAINNHEARTIKIPLHFLDEGEFELTIYKDAENVALNPNNIKIDMRYVTSKDSLSIYLAAGGGMAVYIHPKR